jgi:hypothetical protein
MMTQQDGRYLADPRLLLSGGRKIKDRKNSHYGVVAEVFFASI